MKEAACASFPGTLGPVCSFIAFLLVFFDGIEHALSCYLDSAKVACYGKTAN